MGGSVVTRYIQCVLGNNIEIIQVPGARLLADFGQNRCLHYLKKILSENKVGRRIVYAASQGTATVLNYVAHEGNKAIKAFVLEGVLVSANSAIEHILRSI